jgi:hypothetical protein
MTTTVEAPEAASEREGSARGKSYQIVASGGPKMGDDLKNRRERLVHVETDDFVTKLGLLLPSSNDTTIRLGLCRHAGGKNWRGKYCPEKWEVWEVKKSRIKDLRYKG